MMREWETPERRDQVIEAITTCEDAASLFRLMVTVEEGFCNPW
jgi:hypothetical protein